MSDKQTNMTAEEAIKKLNDILEEATKTDNSVCYVTSDDADALKQAIEALKAKPCTDAVSGQAVIDMTGLSEWFDSSNSYNEFVFALNDLPPVMPQPKIAHWMLLKDEHGDVIEAVCSSCDNNGNHKWNLCPYCGAIMIDSQESEGKE